MGSEYEAGQAVPAEPARSLPPPPLRNVDHGVPAQRLASLPPDGCSDVPRTVASTGLLEDSRKQMLKMRKIVQGEGWKTPIKMQGEIVPL